MVGKARQNPRINCSIKKASGSSRGKRKGHFDVSCQLPRFDFPTGKPGENPIISQPMVKPGTVVFFEKYESWEAFETHLYGPYFTSFVNEYKSFFVAGFDDNPFVEVVFLDEQIGFKR
jgi:hypothetical protein